MSIPVPKHFERASSYKQIFKSTALIGLTQIITILIGIIRTKFLAVLLGPAGVGIIGLYQSTMGLIGTVAGFGIGRAGIRQIAEAHGIGDEDKIALTSKALRRVSVGLGLLGVLIVLIFCKPLAWITFGNYDYTWGVAIVSLVLLFEGISAGQMALLQGMRKLKDLAACQIYGAVFGSIASVAIVYFGGARAVVWYLVAIAAFGALISWWYATKLKIKPSNDTTQNIIVEARGLLKMGAAFMVSGLVSTGTLYVTRVMVISELGMGAVGLYTAVITLSSIYVNMVLQAMVSDYYPRLTAVATDHKTVNRMVNEQTEMGLLIAVPGILGMISLAPWVLNLFYSQEFSLAADVIRWQLLGVALRVLSWPIAIIMPAKGLSRLMILAEMIAGIVQIATLLICIKLWGLEGTGISFLFTYMVYTAVVYIIANKKTGFCWARKPQILIVIAFIVITSVFLSSLFLTSLVGIIVGLLITAATSVGCFFTLKRMLGFSLFERKA